MTSTLTKRDNSNTAPLSLCPLSLSLCKYVLFGLALNVPMIATVTLNS